MFVASGTGEGPAPKKDRRWLWGLGAWLLWFVVADDVFEAALHWLVRVGVGAAMTFWPILGAAILWVGRMEMAHARVMDARRGQPPAPMDQD